MSLAHPFVHPFPANFYLTRYCLPIWRVGSAMPWMPGLRAGKIACRPLSGMKLVRISYEFTAFEGDACKHEVFLRHVNRPENTGDLFA